MISRNIPVDILDMAGKMVEFVQPLASQRNVEVFFRSKETECTELVAADELFCQFVPLLLKMICVVIPGTKMEVSLTYVQTTVDDRSELSLRLELILPKIAFNPNLLLPFEKKRLVFDNSGLEISRIFVEEPVGGTRQETTSQAYTANLHHFNPIMDSERLATSFQSRLTFFGNDRIVVSRMKSSPKKQDEQYMETLNQLVHDKLDNENLDSKLLCREMGISRVQLFRKLKRMTGLSITNYIRHVRLQKATEYLESTTMSIGQIASKVGFKDLSYFTNSFGERFQMSPSEWRRNKSG